MDPTAKDLKSAVDRLQRLVDASYLLHSTLDLDQLLARILHVAADGVGADRGTVFLLDKERNELWSRVLSGDERLEIRLPVGKGIAGVVAATGKTIRIADAYADPRFDPSWDQRSGYQTKQVLCAPIRNRMREIVGVFQLLNKDQGEFTARDEDYLEGLSINAALALENAQLHASAIEKERYDREVALAQSVQRQLQPEMRALGAGRLQAAGLNELCEDATGDYYDLLHYDNWLGLAIGDVSGHGLQAALVMTETRAYLRAFARTAPSPAVAVELLNDFLVPDMVGGKFISLFVAVVDTETGSMRWCNGGHNPPLVRRTIGGIERLEGTGHVLGILPRARYYDGEELSLEPGDALLLYTDGVTEARSPTGEFFGQQRLEETLAASDGDPEAILKAIRGRVHEWTGGTSLEDDLTLVAVTRR